MLTHTDDKVEMEYDQKVTEVCSRGEARNPRRERRLWDNPEQTTSALGCHVCPDRALCGGLHPEITFYDCLQFCCDKPDTCDRVCRKHPDFPDWVREVGGFDLETIPRSQILVPPRLPDVVPVIYHRDKCSRPIQSPSVALPLYQIVDWHIGALRFPTSETLCEAFGIHSDTIVMLTGTNRDRSLERWWGLGELHRRHIIRTIKAAGVTMVTTPNYSLFTDRPRWDNLHSIKRIAITHAEFLNEGLPAALHVNGRTETDFHRWASYISARPEITHLAYEFTTGTGWARRQEQHAIWLKGLAAKIGRPLHLVMRGGTKILPILLKHFSGITMLDTTSFMKTVKRQRAYPKGDTIIGWKQWPMAIGAPLDDLFAHNMATVETWLRNLISSSIKERRVSG